MELYSKRNYCYSLNRVIICLKEETMKKKIFLTPIFLFLIVVFLSGCLPGKQPKIGTAEKTEISSKSETMPEEKVPAGWKTYKNDKYNFSFSYPADWEFEVTFDQENLFSISIVKKDTTQEKIQIYEEEMVASYNMMVRVEPNKKGISAKEKRLSLFGAKSRDQEEKNLKPYTVGGIKGIRFFEGAAPASGPVTMVLLAHNDSFYQFSYGALATKKTHEKFLKDFELLLSTVEFF